MKFEQILILDVPFPIKLEFMIRHGWRLGIWVCILWKLCALQGWKKNPQDIFEYIKSYEQIGRRRPYGVQAAEKERTAKAAGAASENRQTARAKTIWVGEKSLSAYPKRTRASLNAGGAQANAPKYTLRLRPPPTVCVCVCWCIWSIKFYTLPSGLNRIAIMVRLCQH